MLIYSHIRRTLRGAQERWSYNIRAWVQQGSWLNRQLETGGQSLDWPTTGANCDFNFVPTTQRFTTVCTNPIAVKQPIGMPSYLNTNMSCKCAYGLPCQTT